MGVLETIIGGVTGFLDRRSDRKLKEKELELKAQEQGNEANRDTWKDEYAVLLVTAPVVILWTAVLMAWPDMVERVFDAFDAMDRLPEWYREMFVVTVYSALGILGIVRPTLKLLDKKGRRNK